VFNFILRITITVSAYAKFYCFATAPKEIRIFGMIFFTAFKGKLHKKSSEGERFDLKKWEQFLILL
jgi:hypothetical protein